MIENMKTLTIGIATLLVSVLPVTSWAGGKQSATTLNCRVYGFRAETVYMDCNNNPAINAQFPAQQGEDMTMRFAADRLTVITVNDTEILIEPGDSLCADIRFGSKSRRPESIEFTGSPRSVVENEILQSLENYRNSLRYKEQLLACAIVDIKPAERIADSEKLMQRVNETLKRTKSKTSAEFRNYVSAYYESMYWMSKIEYPAMYAELRKVPFDKQGIGDYWAAADKLKLRKDDASLNCFPYYELILRYCTYCGERAATAKGETYVRPDELETAYSELASFYKGSVRDAALYALLGNYIRQGVQIERVDALMPDYLKKYNRNKQFAATLDALMQ